MSAGPGRPHGSRRPRGSGQRRWGAGGARRGAGGGRGAGGATAWGCHAWPGRRQPLMKMLLWGCLAMCKAAKQGGWLPAPGTEAL